MAELEPKFGKGKAPEPETKATDDLTDTESELFESEEEEEEESESVLGEDEALELKDKKVSVETFKKRIGKLVSQRELSRAEAEAARREAEALRGVLKTYTDKYRTNPALAAFDHDFAETFENLAKVDPSVAAVGKRIEHYLKTGEFKPLASVNPTPAPEPKADPRVEKLFEKVVTETINETLKAQGLKDTAVAVIRKHILSTEDDLASLDEAKIIASAKAYIKDVGLSREDVLRAAVTPKPRPSTGTGRRAGEKPARSAEGEAEEKAPKNYDDWQKGRERRFRSVARELFGREES